MPEDTAWERSLAEAFWLSFTKSLEELSSKSGAPLGFLAEHLVIYLTSPKDTPEEEALSLDLIYSYPVLAVYGQIEASYIELRKKAKKDRDATLFGEGLMPFIRVISLPASDQVFSMRKRDTKVLASAIISKNLRIIFDRLRDYHYASELGMMW